jgi:hypothetical protein
MATTSAIDDPGCPIYKNLTALMPSVSPQFKILSENAVVDLAKWAPRSIFGRFARAMTSNVILKSNIIVRISFGLTFSNGHSSGPSMTQDIYLWTQQASSGPTHKRTDGRAPVWGSEFFF